MNQLSFYNYNFKKDLNLDNFIIEQEEIIIKDRESKTLENIPFIKNKVIYKCFLKQNKEIDKNKPGAIICIHKNIKLLKFLLDKLNETDVQKYVNLLIVEDRADNKIIEIECNKRKINYLSVNNDSHFNFSMLNNIGAHVFNQFGCTEIILWNSDLWPSNKEVLPKVLSYHRQEKSVVTGARLMYPEVSWDGSCDIPENISNFFQGLKDYRGTVQFGGSTFIYINSGVMPSHYGRFSKTNKYCFFNKICDFITGAFTVIDIKYFKELGGLNPSLSSQFQDIDFSLKCRENNYKVCYFGEDFFYHDESVSLKDKTKDKSFISDHILYFKLWLETGKIQKIILGVL